MIDARNAAQAVFSRELVEHAVRERHSGYAQASMGHVVVAFHDTFEEGAKELVTSLVHSAGSAAASLFAAPPAPAWPKQAPHPRGRHARRAPRLAVELRLEFDTSTPEVRKWIEEYTAQLVTGVTDEVRAAINETMQRAFDQHMTATEAASLLEDVIGLDSRRSEALDSFLDDLYENPGGTVMRGDTEVRVPEEITDDFIEKQAEKYASELIADRAEMIARTETIAAANGGQQLLWQQAADEGLIDTSRYERTWIVSDDDRLCDDCAEMDDERAPIDGTFDTPDGPLDNPPLHPNCRCSQGIATIESYDPQTDDEADNEDSFVAAAMRNAESIYGKPGTPEYWRNYYQANKDKYKKWGANHRQKKKEEKEKAKQAQPQVQKPGEPPPTTVEHPNGKQPEPSWDYTVVVDPALDNNRDAPVAARMGDRALEQIKALGPKAYGITVEVTSETVEFEVAGARFSQGGCYSPSSQVVTVNYHGMGGANADTEVGGGVDGLIAHELQHHVFHEVTKNVGIEDSGFPLMEEDEEHVASTGRQVSSYAEAYWNKYEASGSSKDYSTAVNETLAEVAKRVKMKAERGGSSGRFRHDLPKEWRELYDQMLEAYKGDE